MNKAQLTSYKKFYTIEKNEFNYFAQRLVNKKYEFFTGDKLPPNYAEVMNPTNKRDVLELHRTPYAFGAGIGFKKNPVSDEIKKRFAENIKLQSDIMRVVKKRNEEYCYRSGIIKVKTGMGKSVIAMDIIEYLQTPTLILVSNKKLMSEMIDKFDEMTNYKGIINQYGDGKKDIGHLTVMTKKGFNLCEDEDQLSEFETIIMDEAQQGFSEKFRDKFNTVFHDKEIFFYGMSATPFTSDFNEEDLEKYYGKIIEIKKHYDFIPKFTFYNYRSLVDYEFEMYHELKQALIDDTKRHELQLEKIYENLSSKCSLILGDRLEEIEMYYSEFSKSLEYNVIKITGETDIKDDKLQLDAALRSKKPIIICGSIQKTSTGFDYPIIDAVFLFSSIKFEATVIQSVGRALRKAPDKSGAEIFIWNDKILDKQRQQKQKAIYEEYGVHYSDINNIWINKERKSRKAPVLTF